MYAKREKLEGMRANCIHDSEYYGWVQQQQNIVALVALVWDVSYIHLGPVSE